MSFGLRKAMVLHYKLQESKYGAMVYTEDLPTGECFTSLPKEPQEQQEMSDIQFIKLLLGTIEAFGDGHPLHEVIWRLVEDKGVISCEFETYSWQTLKPIFANTDEWGEFVRTRG